MAERLLEVYCVLVPLAAVGVSPAGSTSLRVVRAEVKPFPMLLTCSV